MLDVIHPIQATQAGDLACRWNCKAGKCGSCSAEINGKPRLMCMTRMNTFEPGETITVSPIKTFPLIRDLATDVSFNYEKAKQIPAFKPGPKEAGRHAADAAGGRRAEPGVPQVHRVLPLPERLPRHPRSPGEQAGLRGAALPHADRRARDAPARHQRPPRAGPGQGRARLLQHHQVLHRGLPRAHPHHGQRPHPAQGARGDRELRSGRVARRASSPASPSP